MDHFAPFPGKPPGHSAYLNLGGEWQMRKWGVPAEAGDTLCYAQSENSQWRRGILASCRALRHFYFPSLHTDWHVYPLAKTPVWVKWQISRRLWHPTSPPRCHHFQSRLTDMQEARKGNLWQEPQLGSCLLYTLFKLISHVSLTTLHLTIVYPQQPPMRETTIQEYDGNSSPPFMWTV